MGNGFEGRPNRQGQIVVPFLRRDRLFDHLAETCKPVINQLFLSWSQVAILTTENGRLFRFFLSRTGKTCAEEDDCEGDS